MLIDKENIQNLPFFFIVGRPRSGTTLITSIIDAQPHVIIPFECPLILELYPKYRHITSWDDKKISVLLRDIYRTKKFAFWKIEPSTLKEKITAPGKNFDFHTLIKRIYTSYVPLFEKSDIRLLGDKNPIYSLYPEEIFGIFPEAKYIHLVRDFRDQISSMLHVDFELPNSALLAFRWKYSAKKMEKLKHKHPSSFFTVRYEDIVDNPQGKIKEICTFLDIDYNDGMLEFYKIKDKAYSTFSEKTVNLYHSKLYHPITPEYAGNWKNILTKMQVKITELIASKYALRYGYEPFYEKPGILIYISALPGLSYAFFWLIQKKLLNSLPYPLHHIIQKMGNIIPRLYNVLFKKG